MNPHAQLRLDFARGLSARLESVVGIQAIVVGGSVAREYSDAYSDLELILYWNQSPDIDTQREIVRDLGAEFRYPEFDPGHNSALLIQGFPVDLWHHTVADQYSVMDGVMNEYNTDLHLNSTLDTLSTCIPLRGERLVHQWKKHLQGYPDELAAGFLQTYLPHFHLRQLSLVAQRENPTAFYNMLTNIQSSLFLVLLALNKRYFPTFKWIYHRLAEMTMKPADVSPRLRAMFHASPDSVASDLRSVLMETLELVELCRPEIDTEFAHYGLNQTVQKYQVPTI